MPQEKEDQFPDLSGKLPPQNIEAEEAILGGILLDPEAMGRIVDVLRPEMFYVSAHQEIFRACLMLHNQGRPTDLMSVTTWLSDRALLEKVGGQEKIITLCDRTLSAVNIDYYAELVQEKYIRRQLAKAGMATVDLSFASDMELAQVLDRAEQTIFAVTQARTQQGLVPAGDILTQTFYELEAKANAIADGNQIMGITTGFYDLDNLTNGLQRSDLIIIAGRPSMGKTSFGLELARKVAEIHYLPVAIFSLEMSREQLIYRLLSSQSKMRPTDAGIDSNRLRSGQISENEWGVLTTAISRLSELPIYIDDSPNPSVTELRSKVRRLQAEKASELGLVLIDYLQLMEGSGSDNRVQEISRITRSLKSLAREMKVPVIALSQLSRGVESRTNKRPMLSDLRESGCLSGDSLITLADTGNAVPIGELVGCRNVTVWALNPHTGRQERAMVSHAFCTGAKMVYRLQTQLGRFIKATPNHQFFTPQGWQRLENLRIGDRVAVPQSMTNAEASAQLYWDQVVSLTPLGTEMVYDLTVPTLANFLANHIYVHNSIEQDADLVINLYRDEYYNPDTPDRGIAEIIIAKHRNGPTGTVKLLFDSRLTKFENITTR
jgi:replicative DNA helicase